MKEMYMGPPPSKKVESKPKPRNDYNPLIQAVAFGVDIELIPDEVLVMTNNNVVVEDGQK